LRRNILIVINIPITEGSNIQKIGIEPFTVTYKCLIKDFDRFVGSLRISPFALFFPLNGNLRYQHVLAQTVAVDLRKLIR